MKATGCTLYISFFFFFFYFIIVVTLLRIYKWKSQKSHLQTFKLKTLQISSWL
jgi:hypothetical protein